MESLDNLVRNLKLETEHLIIYFIFVLIVNVGQKIKIYIFE